MLTGMYMKGSGKTIKVRDMACICILMELSTKVSGLRTNKKGMDLKLGLMERSMKEDTKTG